MIEILIGMILLPVIKYVIGYRLGNYLNKKIDEQPAKYSRLKVIWNHYVLRIKEQGHGTADVFQCREGDCASLSAGVSVQLS